jgi:hypothetical protein
MFRLALIVLALIVAACFWPVTRGDFVIDDYVFIAQSRIVDAPWEALWRNHFYEPTYFRPIGVLIWWITTNLFDLDYVAHSTINLVLHLLNAWLLAYLVRMLTSRVSAAIAAAALFALLPFAFAATFWPSNRFDLLATLFLLLTVITSVQFLRNGKPLSWLAAGAAALAACLSKEFAYPVATAVAFCCLLSAAAAPIQRRSALFVLLGAAIGGAFLWRHVVLPLPYAAASADVIHALSKGAVAWVNAIPRLFDIATADSSMARMSIWLAIGVIIFATVTAIVWPKSRGAHVSAKLIVAAAVVFAVSGASQWPLAAAFAPMLDGGSLGTVTFARFYYAPAAAFAVIVALMLTRARLGRSIATIIILCSVVVSFQQRELSTEFARFTREEIRPVSIAATRVADQLSKTSDTSCVLVFLGTQTKQPWFRMFSDVTVKALTTNPARVWQCQTLTESAPWIFVSPADKPLLNVGLPTVPLDSNGTAKPDYTWGGVRYRYRLAPTEFATLPHARFFDWKDGNFVEVTDAVRAGTRVVKSHGWGF